MNGPVLITGATGFVGSALVQALTRNGIEAIGSSRREWDVREAPAAAQFPTRIEAIVHCAALTDAGASEGDLRAANTDACRNVIALARDRRVEHVVYLSTGGVLMRPADRYAASKAAGEKIFEAAADVSSAVVRLYFPYGSGQRDRLIPRLHANILADRPIDLHNEEGSPTINPVYIHDVVKGIVAVLETRTTGSLDLAGPDRVTIREIALAIGARAGRSVSFRSGNAAPFALVGDHVRLRDLLGEPLTTFAAGLDATIHAAAAENIASW